jgi:F-type H+-transporting ATPase subunit delta
VADSKIARVYAGALYQAASEEGRVDDVRRDLGAFVQAVRESPLLQQLLLAEDVSDPRKKAVLLELTDGGEDMVRNFLLLLVDKSREPELEDTYRRFVALAEQAAGLVHVRVVTAVPLTPELEQALTAKLESALQKKVELATQVDEDILGGLELQVGDRVADASIRYRLRKLRESLIRPMANLEESVETAS